MRNAVGLHHALTNRCTISCGYITRRGHKANQNAPARATTVPSKLPATAPGHNLSPHPKNLARARYFPLAAMRQSL